MMKWHHKIVERAGNLNTNEAHNTCSKVVYFSFSQRYSDRNSIKVKVHISPHPAHLFRSQSIGGSFLI